MNEANKAKTYVAGRNDPGSELEASLDGRHKYIGTYIHRKVRAMGRGYTRYIRYIRYIRQGKVK